MSSERLQAPSFILDQGGQHAMLTLTLHHDWELYAAINSFTRTALLYFLLFTL